MSLNVLAFRSMLLQLKVKRKKWIFCPTVNLTIIFLIDKDIDSPIAIWRYHVYISIYLYIYLLYIHTFTHTCVYSDTRIHASAYRQTHTEMGRFFKVKCLSLYSLSTKINKTSEIQFVPLKNLLHIDYFQS